MRRVQKTCVGCPTHTCVGPFFHRPPGVVEESLGLVSNITFLENTIKKVVFRFKAFFLNTLGSKEAPTHLFGPLRTGLKSPYARPTRRVRRVLRRVRRDRKFISFDFCFFFWPLQTLYHTFPYRVVLWQWEISTYTRFYTLRDLAFFTRFWCAGCFVGKSCAQGPSQGPS